jgi:hypothetical protein
MFVTMADSLGTNMYCTLATVSSRAIFHTHDVSAVSSTSVSRWLFLITVFDFYCVLLYGYVQRLRQHVAMDIRQTNHLKTGVQSTLKTVNLIQISLLLLKRFYTAYKPQGSLRRLAGIS